MNNTYCIHFMILLNFALSCQHRSPKKAASENSVQVKASSSKRTLYSDAEAVGMVEKIKDAIPLGKSRRRSEIINLLQLNMDKTGKKYTYAVLLVDIIVIQLSENYELSWMMDGRETGRPFEEQEIYGVKIVKRGQTLRTLSNR